MAKLLEADVQTYIAGRYEKEEIPVFEWFLDALRSVQI
jgi:hypothetical protein